MNNAIEDTINAIYQRFSTYSLSKEELDKLYNKVDTTINNLVGNPKLKDFDGKKYGTNLFVLTIHVDEKLIPEYDIQVRTQGLVYLISTLATPEEKQNLQEFFNSLNITDFEYTPSQNYWQGMNILSGEYIPLSELRTNGKLYFELGLKTLYTKTEKAEYISGLNEFYPYNGIWQIVSTQLNNPNNLSKLYDKMDPILFDIHAEYAKLKEFDNKKYSTDLFTATIHINDKLAPEFEIEVKRDGLLNLVKNSIEPKQLLEIQERIAYLENSNEHNAELNAWRKTSVLSEDNIPFSQFTQNKVLYFNSAIKTLANAFEDINKNTNQNIQVDTNLSQRENTDNTKKSYSLCDFYPFNTIFQKFSKNINSPDFVENITNTLTPIFKHAHTEELKEYDGETYSTALYSVTIHVNEKLEPEYKIEINKDEFLRIVKDSITPEDIDEIHNLMLMAQSNDARWYHDPRVVTWNETNTLSRGNIRLENFRENPELYLGLGIKTLFDGSPNDNDIEVDNDTDKNSKTDNVKDKQQRTEECSMLESECETTEI